MKNARFQKKCILTETNSQIYSTMSQTYLGLTDIRWAILCTSQKL